MHAKDIVSSCEVSSVKIGVVFGGTPLTCLKGGLNLKNP